MPDGLHDQASRSAERALAVLKPIPYQEGGGKKDDSEEDPVEHGSRVGVGLHVKLLSLGDACNLRMPHAGSCELLFTSGLPYLRGSSGTASRPRYRWFGWPPDRLACTQPRKNRPAVTVHAPGCLGNRHATV